MYGVTCMSFCRGRLEPKFARMRVLKLMAMALNIKFSNIVETQLPRSVYHDSFYFPFKRRVDLYNNIEEIDNAVNFIDGIRQKLIDLGTYKDYSWSEIHEFFKNRVDYGKIVVNCNPYDRNTVQSFWKNDGDELFIYRPFVRNVFKREDDFDQELKQRMFIKPRSLVGFDPKSLDRKQKEKKSGQPLYLVYALMKKFERFLVVDDQSIAFLVGIASNELDVMDVMRLPLKKLNICKNEQSLTVKKWSLFYFNRFIKSFIHFCALEKLFKIIKMQKN